MPVQITDQQQVSYTLIAEDAKGFPTTLTDVPTWTPSDPTIISVTVAPDGMSALVVGLKPGVAQLAVLDPATGISGQDQVTVVPDAAASLVLNAGAPVPQPAPAPASAKKA